MTHKWLWTPLSDEEITISNELTNELKLDPVVGRLLVKRGIGTAEDARAFFAPKLEDLHDPFLMKDMDRAVARLNKALGKREPILIYGDYDVDGTTAVTLVYKFLRLSGSSDKELHYYIPDRYEDGYGVSKLGIDKAHALGVKLIIVLDCGIKAVEEIAYAKSLGIDFIICDHHTPGAQLPDAVAVLDPKRSDNTYPDRELSGCGIGFKFMQAFAINNNIRMRRLHSLLDLVAVSIASDVVSTLGENRILAHYGLQQLNRNPSPGLRGIINTCNLHLGEIDMSSIVFKIGPMINASGRMIDGKKTVDLLISHDIWEAEEKCLEIVQYNDQRRELDKSTTRDAIRFIEEFKPHRHHNIIVIYKPEWHKGVIGIVASRIAERYARPTVVLSGVGEKVSGSGRGYGGFDMYHAIEHCRDLLTNFGGHPYAAGLTIDEKYVQTFTERIEQYADATITPKQFNPEIVIDAVLSLREITRSLHKSLEKMGPFGPDNPKPIFMTRFLFDTGTSKAVGKNGEHIKLDVTDSPQMLQVKSGIAFGLSSHISYIKSYRPFSLLYTVEQNDFYGTPSVQMLVKDIRHEDDFIL